MSDIESDDEIPELSCSPSSTTPTTNEQAIAGPLDEGRRAHHNALERKRRDHIKDSFLALKEVVPTLKGERASRALILRKACDYIDGIKSKIEAHEQDIQQLRAQNAQLEAQIQAFETANRVLEQCRPEKNVLQQQNQRNMPPTIRNGFPRLVEEFSTGEQWINPPGAGDRNTVVGGNCGLREQTLSTVSVASEVDVNDPHGLIVNQGTWNVAKIDSQETSGSASNGFQTDRKTVDMDVGENVVSGYDCCAKEKGQILPCLTGEMDKSEERTVSGEEVITLDDSVEDDGDKESEEPGVKRVKVNQS